MDLLIAINELNKLGRSDIIKKLRDNQVGRRCNPDEWTATDRKVVEHIKKLQNK